MVVPGKMVLDEVFKQVEHLPTIPQVVMTVLQMTESPNINTKKISDSLDQSLAAKVLKIANSAYYGGGRARNVKSIPHAIVIIGFEALKEIVLTASVFHTFHDVQDVKSLQPLWEHSLEAALIAKRLAWIYRYEGLDEAYFAGLIHDLGKLVIHQYFRDQYSLIEDMKKNGEEELAAEKQVMGITHAEVSGKISEFWSFPETLVDTITHHHDENFKLNPKLGKIIRCADQFVRGAWDFSTMLSAFAQVGMLLPKEWEASDVEAVEKILRDEIEKAHEMLSFSKDMK
jgi:putative nucleotidyltransferase with HDIG domain